MDRDLSSRWMLASFLCTAALLCGGPGNTRQAIAQRPPEPPAAVIPITEGLVLPPVGNYGRTPLIVDFLEARRVAGIWTTPKSGGVVSVPGGPQRRWQPIQATSDGWFRHGALRGGYFVATVESPTRRTMILEARGHGFVRVGGVPHTGDPYSYGILQTPVQLEQGANEFLFHVGRGQLRAQLVQPPARISIAPGDMTLPDVILGERGPLYGAIVVVNAGERPTGPLLVQACAGALHTRKKVGAADVSEVKPLEFEEPRTLTLQTPIPPLSSRKIAFPIRCAVTDADAQNVDLKIVVSEKIGAAVAPSAERVASLRVTGADQLHRRTFVSRVDGSVQYYAVRPAKPDPANPDAPAEGDSGTSSAKKAERPALFLTLHGASVEGSGQAAVYAPKTWGHVVAPTNRRSFGFDWEDWGRIDALEVLADAERRLQTDPRRTYLTGHSMGGHGSWHLGVTYPHRFAAIGPSAGWIDFWSYGGALTIQNPNPAQQLLLRATGPSRTLSMVRNFENLGVYILHGEKDDNVPVAMARQMRIQLAAFHPDFVYKEQPGAGHWWGNQCCDWKPMFEYFAHHRLPERSEVRHVVFRTANPAVSSEAHWATVLSQIKHSQRSKIDIEYDPAKRLFTGTTQNVARLLLDTSHVKPGTGGDRSVTVTLDGNTLTEINWTDDVRRIWLSRSAGRWSVIAKAPASLKGPHRYGPFKHVFDNNVLLVYGTKGTSAENDWSLNKARYDAESFYYRGNGSMEVIADTSLDLDATRDRNIVLYGNADTNAAWKALLAESPVQLGRGELSLGQRKQSRDDLACLFIRPRAGSDRALVGVVGGTGIIGMRAATRTTYFVSGVGYPDLLVYGADSLSKGSAALVAVGYFAEDWGVEKGEFAWRGE